MISKLLKFLNKYAFPEKRRSESYVVALGQFSHGQNE